MLTIHPCSEFLKQFLAKRNLSSPTGSALYSYKTTQAEYEKLKKVLTQAPTARSTSDCFVLFAAEWWRRHYEGGSWEWEPIFEEIHKKNWNTAQQRRQFVMQGLDYWRRPIFQHDEGPNSYLGTLFFESGLPVRLLTNEGYVRALLIKSFAFLETHRISHEDTIELVRDQVGSLQLPEVLNVEPFFKLIYEVVNVLLTLKKTHALGLKEQPLTFLNEHVPSWRDTLPVRLDDGPSGGYFLDSLLIDVARIARPESSKIGVAYRLIQDQQGWKVDTVLTIPDGNHKPENLLLDPEKFAAFSGKVRIGIVYEGTEQLIGYGFITGNNLLSVNGLTSVHLPETIYATPWSLVFADSQNDQQLRVNLPYSDGLDKTLPWVFSPQTDTTALLKGVGSVRLLSGKAWVVCPTTFDTDCEDGGIAGLGDFSEIQTVYELSSTCHLKDIGDDQTFRIRLSAQQEDDYYFSIHPQRNTNRINVCHQQNANLFLGFPRICKIHKQGGWRVYCADKIEYKNSQQATWQKVMSSEQLLGRFRVRLMGSDGEVLFSKEISVLPAKLGIAFSTATQSVLLTNTDTLQVSVQDDSLEQGVRIAREHNGYRISIPAGYSADKLKIRLSNPATKAVDLYVPSLTTLSYFTDATDNLIANNQTVDFQGLYGTHLVLNNISAQEQSRRVTLTLIDHHNPDASLFFRTKTVKLVPFSNVEISLIKYKGEIERLLSFTDTIDATVRIQPEGGTSLQVAQFAYQTTYNNQDQLITLKRLGGGLEYVQMQAFPLGERFDPDKLIDLSTHETGWTFPENMDKSGKWFYFSKKGAAANLRPSVAILADWIDEDTCETVNEIHEASNHSFSNRQTVLTSLFNRIATDFGNLNWRTLQHLNNSTQHLPLNALDVWKALVKSDKGLVTFFLQFDPVTIGKLSREFSVNWHKITVTIWLEGFSAYYDTLPVSVATLIVEQKLQELEASFSLNSLAQIIRIELLGGKARQDFQICQHQFFIQPEINREIVGEIGRPGLIQRHNSQRFPTHLSREVIGSFNRLPETVKDILSDLPSGFLFVRSIAYLPVLFAYQSVNPDALYLGGFNSHQVTQLIDFDEEYFYHIYNLAQSFCWLNRDKI